MNTYEVCEDRVDILTSMYAFGLELRVKDRNDALRIVE